MPHRLSLLDRIAAALGGVLIAAVLTAARLWTRLTRATWHDP